MKQQQKSLWDEGPPAIEPCDPNVDDRDKPRLTGQCLAILELLRTGPCTNRELACISLKYTGRISDLRAAGYRIECLRGDGGFTTYHLIEPTA